MIKLPVGNVPGVVVAELKQDVLKLNWPMRAMLPSGLALPSWTYPETSYVPPPEVVKVPVKVRAVPGRFSWQRGSVSDVS